MFDPPYGQIAPLVVCRVGRGLGETHQSARLLFPWASTRPAAFANVTSLLLTSKVLFLSKIVKLGKTQEAQSLHIA